MDRESSATPFVDRLVDAGSNLGRQLAASMDVPLRDYLRGLIPTGRAHPPNRSLLLLATAFDRYLVGRGETEIADVRESLLRTPVIQQADHSNLLLDSETFLNNLLFHLAAREAGLGIAITSQCSTVACLSRRLPVRGPVFLWSRAGCYRLFDYSKRLLKNSSFCTLPMPTRFTIRPLEGPVPPAASDPVLAQLVGRTVEDPAEAFRSANAEIWARLDVDQHIRRVAIDERLASEAIALHIEHGDGPVFRLFFDPPVRDAFVHAKRRLVASNRNIVVNRPEPDFLWWRRGTRLHELVLEGTGEHARFVASPDRSSPPFRLEPRSVVAGLRRGELYGDRFMAYLVRCLLPGVVAVGGTVQQDYVDLYRTMLLETHQEVKFLDEADLQSISRPDLTRLGGAPLVELTPAAARMLQFLGPGTRLREFETVILDEPVGRTIGCMQCASFYDVLLARRARRQAG